ncbi:CCA tRNA nucleotidyltransferase [hydrothermal vent metagenome]|uniref:CCA tRNA nucleotidyltransferase n=1 Tax=hydrothermal vent metagenome TaxID=652676 RepID=A0A3B0TVR1_9ZZZZ
MTSVPLPSIAGAKVLRDRGLAQVFAAIQTAGGQARIVGGAIRDTLVGRKCGDVDVATTLSPDAVMAAATAFGIKAIPTGFDHGTVTLVVAGRPIEVTTLRRDVQTDGRRAVVAFTADWQIDAMRRDFTMNALYADLDGTLHDPAGGYADLLRRRVRFIGEPAARIEEDVLRILRFFRFHAEFGRGDLDRQGLGACAMRAGDLAGLSAERVRLEVLRLLAAPGVMISVGAMHEAGILRGLGLVTVDIERLRRLVAIEGDLLRSGDGLLRLGALALGEAHDAHDLAARLRLSKLERDRLSGLEACGTHLHAAMDIKALHALSYRMGKLRLLDCVLLAWSSDGAAATSTAWAETWREAERFAPPAFPVSGRDLLAIGARPGPPLGRALSALEDEWIEGDFRAGRDELLRRFKARGT